MEGGNLKNPHASDLRRSDARNWGFIVSPLTPEQMEHFRGIISGMSAPDSYKDELIHIIDKIAVSFIDQSFGISSIQLSLSARANFSFLGIQEYATQGKVLDQKPRTENRTPKAPSP
jgi:hypothetical protein